MLGVSSELGGVPEEVDGGVTRSGVVLKIRMIFSNTVFNFRFLQIEFLKTLLFQEKKFTHVGAGGVLVVVRVVILTGVLVVIIIVLGGVVLK